jgi:hypothetical protein
MNGSAAITRIPVEYRFPLHLEPAVATVWDLYNEAKQTAWDPAEDLPWAAPVAASGSEREAARLVFSHRAWLAYGRLSEGPALLVRFCLERQRESDPKYVLAVRGSEDAWHLDACGRLAERFGGFVDGPGDERYAEAFNLALHRQLFSADESLDAHVAALVLDRDALDAALLSAALAIATDPAARAALQLMRRDRERQARFGALYLGERAQHWDAAERARIASAVSHARRQFITSGLLHPALGAGPEQLVAAHEVAAQSGLGGLGRAAAAQVVSTWSRAADTRLAALGLS